MKLLGRLLIALSLVLAQALLPAQPARATVSSAVNKTIVLGDNVTTVFNFNFIGVAAAYISVIYTDASGNETVLSQGAGATQYQITLSPPVTGAIWGVGGTITYAPSGTPIPSGSTLTIFRTLPLTQAISLQNQNSLARLGNGAETGLDTGVMQNQQTSEVLNRTIKAPIVDATPPADLPPIAQRANHGAAFDGSGNLVAGAMPGSGVISSAMQPVVNAATLALGRTAFGLGSVATENIGCGLQDDGANNLRVNSTLVSVAINQSVDATFCAKSYIATGPIAFSLARANTLWNGFTFTVYAFTGAITLTPNVADNFPGLAGGASYYVPAGTVARVTTDGAGTGNWYVQLVPQAVTPPQGYLTPCSATVAVSGCSTGDLVPAGDVTGVSTLYYQAAPAGNMIPLYTGAAMMMVPFPELTLTLNANHLANTVYDVCVSSVGGVPTIMTAPAWQTSTPGIGARGSAAALGRTQGYWTNANAITGRNGASLYAVAAHACTMVGTIAINAAAGQVTFNRSVGQARRWSAYNFYNRQGIQLFVADPTASWGSVPTSFRVSNGNTANYAMALTGLPEDAVSASFKQQASINYGSSSPSANIAIGINSTSAATGSVGTLAVSNNVAGTFSAQAVLLAQVPQAPFLGLNQFYTLEQASTNSAGTTFNGATANMLMSLSWRG